MTDKSKLPTSYKLSAEERAEVDALAQGEAELQVLIGLAGRMAKVQNDKLWKKLGEIFPQSQDGEAVYDLDTGVVRMKEEQSSSGNTFSRGINLGDFFESLNSRGDE